MTDTDVHEGGCLCGRIRYRFTGAPFRASYCHCRMCQRSSGGPVQSAAGVAAAAFRFLGEEPAVYRSSEHCERRFCPTCGSQLEFRDLRGPQWIWLNSGTLDDPGIAPPESHIWCESRIAWFEVADDLPRYPRGAD